MRSGRLILLGVFILLSALVQAQTFNEYQVKSVFVYNFTSFVQWPEAAFDRKDSPFVIVIAGENVFGSYLEEVIKDERVDGHPITIKYVNDLTALPKCHMLFIPGTNNSWGKEDLVKIKAHATLTVSDHELFLQRGGMIYLHNESNKIRLEINDEAAASAGLSVSAKLLRLATIFKSK